MKLQADTFNRGVHQHIHKPNTSNEIIAEAISQMRGKVCSDPFLPAAEIVQSVFRDCVGDEPTQSLPSLSNLTSD